MRIAILGATGLVGTEMIRAIAASALPVTELIPVASSRSAGKEITFRGTPYRVVTPEVALEKKPHLALFSAGGEASRLYAPQFAQIRCKVIDNSSAWRKETDVPLIVPEVNIDQIKPHHHIIANPNCSTIQLVVVLNPLYKRFGFRRVIVSTYQSVSGSGVQGLQQLEEERQGEEAPTRCYPHRIDLNILPHGGDFLPDGTTTEETKLVFETRKILSADDIAISATVARVPVMYGHSESVNIEFNHPADPVLIRETLRQAPGIVIIDDPTNNRYPMPVDVAGRDEVFVGRIRKDASLSHAADLWIVADNLRKGAATNAVQIAVMMHQNGLIPSD